MFVVSAESVKDPLRDAELLPELKKILEDPAAAVEVKFSTLGLICTLANCSKGFHFITYLNVIERRKR